MLITHLALTGGASVVAESYNEPEGTDGVRVYLGEALILTMPADVAEALADALCVVDDVMMWPTR